MLQLWFLRTNTSATEIVYKSLHRIFCDFFVSYSKKRLVEREKYCTFVAEYA